MKHIGIAKRVTFNQDDIDISEISIGQVVVVGFVDHDSRMYKFYYILPYSQGNVLLSHANETKNLWLDIYGHLKYRYLQELSKDSMVEGLPLSFPKALAKGA